MTYSRLPILYSIDITLNSPPNSGFLLRSGCTGGTVYASAFDLAHIPDQFELRHDVLDKMSVGRVQVMVERVFIRPPHISRNVDLIPDFSGKPRRQRGRK
ncbi:hypothetical protein C6369_000475 [Rhodococcus rhodochrous]|nr:hypothetical protein C6369_000475 [Rhodococcus rhodochrous]